MKKIFSTISIVAGIAMTVSAQDYKLDNNLSKTSGWNEFFSRLEQNPKRVFF